MNRIRALLLLLVLACVSVHAENPGHEGKMPPPEEMGGAHDTGEDGLLTDKFIERLDKRLNLTPEQKKKIQVILERNRTELKQKHEELKALRQKMKEAAQGFQKSMRLVKEDIRQSLTLDQREDFDEMMMRMKMGGRRHAMGGKSQGREMRPLGGMPRMKTTEESDEDDDRPTGPPDR